MSLSGSGGCKHQDPGGWSKPHNVQHGSLWTLLLLSHQCWWNSWIDRNKNRKIRQHITLENTSCDLWRNLYFLTISWSKHHPCLDPLEESLGFGRDLLPLGLCSMVGAPPIDWAPHGLWTSYQALCGFARMCRVHLGLGSERHHILQVENDNIKSFKYTSWVFVPTLANTRWIDQKSAKQRENCLIILVGSAGLNCRMIGSWQSTDTGLSCMCCGLRLGYLAYAVIWG